MRTRTPLDRFNLDIKSRDRVVEFGPGHNPTYRSNVLVEKYLDTNYHRSGDAKLYPHQVYYKEDAECTTFKDKEFDYSICIQVAEHAEHPDKFLNEQMRVAKRGYLETPSLIGEFLFPHESHKWVILDIDNKLIFYEKSKLPGNYLNNNYCELFLNYLPFQSIPYRLLWLTEGDLMINRYEWKDSIDYIINPEDEYYKSFFIKPWDRAMTEKIFPKRTFLQELRRCNKGVCHMVANELREKFNRHTPVPVPPDKIFNLEI